MSETVEEYKIMVGMTVSYHDMANPYREGIIVEIKKPENKSFLIFGSNGKTMEPIREEAVIIYPEDWYKSIIPCNDIKENEYAGHQIVDKPLLTLEEVNALVAEYERQQPIKRAAALRTEEERKQKENMEKEQLKKEYSYLIKTEDSKLSSAALGAKNIKIELSKAFPDIKFSTRSEYYSMGCSIDVSWIDGPTRDEVRKITKKYQEGYFDGMIDLYEYNDQVFTDVFGGAKYVFENRKLTEEV